MNRRRKEDKCLKYISQGREDSKSETLPFDMFYGSHIPYKAHPHTCYDIGTNKQKRG
jgi:hypothetical protein